METGLNVTYDGRHGFSLNVSIPAVQGTISAVREDKYVIGGTQGYNDDRGTEKGNLWALSLKKGQEGTLLWNITFMPPLGVPNSTWTSASHQATMRLGTVDPKMASSSSQKILRGKDGATVSKQGHNYGKLHLNQQ